MAVVRAIPNAARAWVRQDRWNLFVLAVLFSLAAGLQVGSGAYDADFCGYPDESIHFVTAVMVSEFLETPFADPMEFASRYYLQYPTLGIGRWPPLGYAVQGIWIRAFGSGRGSVLVSLLLSATFSAWLIYDLTWREAGRLPALAAAAAWLANQDVRNGYEQTMMDIPATSLCLLALAAFRGYADRPSVRASLWFGAVACGALLVKPQAVVLVFFVGAYVLVDRRLDLLRRADFWMAALPTLLIAVPWYALTIPIFYGTPARASGFAGQGSASGQFWGWDLWRIGGVPIFLLSLIGFTRALRQAQLPPRLWACALLGGFACCVVIHAMREPRHVLFFFAAQMALAGLAIGLLPTSFKPWAALALVGTSWGLSTMPTIPHRGHTLAAEVLESGPPGHILLSSPHQGAVIAAAASRHPDLDDRRYWLRSNKLLAEVGLLGNVHQSYVRSSHDVRDLLDRCGINQVYLEGDRNRSEREFEALLRRMLEETPDTWEVVDLRSLIGVEARVFRRREPLPARPMAFLLRKVGTRSRVRVLPAPSASGIAEPR